MNDKNRIEKPDDMPDELWEAYQAVCARMGTEQVQEMNEKADWITENMGDAILQTITEAEFVKEHGGDFPSMIAAGYVSGAVAMWNFLEDRAFKQQMANVDTEGEDK